MSIVINMTGYSKLAQVGPKKKSQTTKNQDANKKLDAIYKKKGIDSCEVRLSKDCLPIEKYSNGELLKHTYAHRHKRVWYKGVKQPLLYSYNETVRACLSCHMMIEADRKLTNAVFTRLRSSLLKGKKA